MFEDASFQYLVTALMRHGCLKRLMLSSFNSRGSSSSRVPYLTESEMIRPARMIFRALDSIHQAGYVHNNIEPGSVLLDREESTGRISVALNGLSECTRQSATRGEGKEALGRRQFDSQSGSPDGSSLLFRAPEFLLNGMRDENISICTTSSDVWSLGALLYFCSCG